MRLWPFKKESTILTEPEPNVLWCTSTVKRPGRIKERDRDEEKMDHDSPGCQQDGGNTWEDREPVSRSVTAFLLCNMALFYKARSQFVQSPGLEFPMENMAKWLAREGWRMRQEFCRNHSSTSQCRMCLPQSHPPSTKCPELKSAQLKELAI